MELQLEKRKIGLNEVVYSGSSEQSIELDYILPDYYSDIFKIIKFFLTCCTLSPIIAITRKTALHKCGFSFYGDN